MLPRLVRDSDYDDDNTTRRPEEGGCGSYVECFEALVRAISRDDAAGVRRALAGGVDPSQPLDSTRTASVLRRENSEPSSIFGASRLGAAPYTTNVSGPWPILPENVPYNVARLTRAMLTTPLGLAAAHGSTAAAEALLDAGAAPWPTPEAVLNEALATMNVTGFKRGSDRRAPVTPYDPVALVRLLLDAFARSPALSAWDVNPLSVVVRGLSGDAALAARGVRPPIGPLLSEMLIDAGYSPDERAAAIILDGDDDGEASLFVRRTPEQRARLAARDVGAQVLEGISALEDAYPDLGETVEEDGQQEEAFEPDVVAPQDVRIQHDLLWALANEYARAGPHTAQEVDNFVEMRILPW
nr:hypothetical protein [Pandoravirus massiliensis]